MIGAHELTKRYGDKTAVDRITFTIAPRSVTGFLGPNGAGKSTTMRMIMGLDRPTTGTVTINGKPYAQHRSPLAEAGALLDAKAVHTGRSARSHLRTMAATHNLPASRVDEVIEITGLAAVAGSASAGSPSACASAWASPRRCSGIRARSSSTNRSTAWPPRACSGWAGWGGPSPTRAEPCSCPRT